MQDLALYLPSHSWPFLTLLPRGALQTVSETRPPLWSTKGHLGVQGKEPRL